MRCLPRRRVQELLTERSATTTQIDVDLAAMKDQRPDPNEPPHAQHPLDLWRSTFRANASWTTQMLGRITTGELRFADDS